MSNSKQGTPEAIEEERELPRPANNNSNNMEQVGVGQPSLGGVGGVARRDENSISFRHFLQPHSDVVPSPAPTCRSRSRGTQPGAVDLVDMAMALPDFVQDHLVVESLAIAEHQNDGGGSQHAGASAVDLNVLNEILPDFDFTASQPSHALPSQSGHTRRRNMQEEQSAAASEVSHGAGGTSALPDFLSDGPMQCTDTNAVDNSMSMSGPSSSRSASRILNSNSLTERNRIVDESSRSTSFDSSDTMRSEVERLRRELAERNRRISQLEGEVLRLRTNASMLETALRTTEQNLTSSETRRLNLEREAGDLRRLTSKENTVGASGDVVPSTSSGVTVNGSVIEDVEMNPHLVRSIATSSEALLSQLLQNMDRLKGLSNATSHRSEERPKKSSEPDEGQQN
ncbi:Angiomotin-like protein 2 [Orchesella cincta]|uniref:Angiomotin-like protein 2 n=1 Tax=Orchesella cincta TaxID=48709 RepID=A0A1D2NJZ2_ORCCI|nr:Angiomotin-like protein 2 [Orchesella cincta]